MVKGKHPKDAIVATKTGVVVGVSHVGQTQWNPSEPHSWHGITSWIPKEPYHRDNKSGLTGCQIKIRRCHGKMVIDIEQAKCSHSELSMMEMPNSEAP